MSDVPASGAAKDPEQTLPEVHQETVSYDRFQLANKQARDAQQTAAEKDKALKEMQDRLEELENQGKSETEQERARREKAEKQLETLQGQVEEQSKRIALQERGGWVAAAAAAAKFADPQDAVALANLSEIEDVKDAEKAVKKLADSKPHLVRQETPGQQIGQVLEGGRPPQPGQSAQDARREGDEQLMAELKAAVNRGQVSVPGLLEE